MRCAGWGARACCSIAAWVVLGAWDARVGAAESDELIKKGIEQRRQGRDAAALELFRQAHEIDKGARSEAQMGLAEQALGMWPDAEKHIKGALARGDDPWIKKNSAIIRKALDVVTSHLGSLEVWGTPAGAEVLIGGHRTGELPLGAPLRIGAGTVAVTVRAAGFVAVSRVIDVPAGGSVRERFELSRPVTQAPIPQLAMTRPAEPKLIVARAPEGEEPAPASRSVWNRWWFWTLVGAVAVGGATAVVVLMRPKNDCPTNSSCSQIGSK